MTRPASHPVTLVRTGMAVSLGAAFLLAAPSTAADSEIHRAAAAQQPQRIGQTSASKAEARSDSSRVVAASALAASCGGVAIAPGSTPGGYLPLNAFGSPQVSGIGDDTVTTFNVPSFRYAGRSWSELQVSSNGYVLAGPTPDNSIANQSFPDSTAPNNVMAPFWTDLNPAAAGSVWINVLTDGDDEWIVVDWNGVREFSSATNTHSFEVWIGIEADASPGQDVSYAYGTNTGNGDGGFASVGAENGDGTSGGNTYYNGVGTLPTNGTELQVTDPGGDLVADFTATPTSGPAPLHVDFDASASSDDGTIDEYHWDFGDSSTGSGVTTDHDYPAGTYTATLTVTDDEDNTCSTSQEITSFEGFSIDDVTVNEAAGTATFTVVRPGGQAASVDVTAVPGTAKEPADFSAAGTTLTFAPGQTSQSYAVTINQDTLDEPAESYFVRLSNPAGGFLADRTGVGTIQDDDAAPSVSVNDASVIEGNTGTKPMTFRVSLDQASGKTVRVRFRTANGSAVAPGDYSSRTVTLTFSPGQTQKTVNVPVVGDRRREHDEAFFVLLNNPVNVTIGDSKGFGAIIDND